MCCFLAATLLFFPFLLHLQLEQLPRRKERRETAIDKAMTEAISKGRIVNRVDAVLKIKSPLDRGQYGDWRRTCIYQYKFQNRSYYYFTREAEPRSTITLYFFNDKPCRACFRERDLFRPGKGRWLKAYVLLAVWIWLLTRV